MATYDKPWRPTFVRGTSDFPRRGSPGCGLAARRVDLHQGCHIGIGHGTPERALRDPVIHRKLSLGTQSDHGERFAERALSAAATCRMQHRSLFTYLSELLAAHNRGDPFPALT